MVEASRRWGVQAGGTDQWYNLPVHLPIHWGTSVPDAVPRPREKCEFPWVQWRMLCVLTVPNLSKETRKSTAHVRRDRHLNLVFPPATYSNVACPQANFCTRYGRQSRICTSVGTYALFEKGHVLSPGHAYLCLDGQQPCQALVLPSSRHTWRTSSHSTEQIKMLSTDERLRSTYDDCHQGDAVLWNSACSTVIPRALFVSTCLLTVRVP
jgi:hypothetical protein